MKYFDPIMKVDVLEKLERRDGKMVIVLAGVAFVGLFCAWVIVPTILRKRHARNTEVTSEE
jgi:hypothetical protein